MQHQNPQKLYPIGPYLVGMIVGYMKPKHEPEREWLSARRWHALHVMSGWEGDVAKALEDDGMAAYVPRIEMKVRVNARRHCKTRRPMFPGYLFAGFDPNGDLWPRIRSIEGVIRLFMVDFRPISIPWAVMDRIREIEADPRTRGDHKPPFAAKVGDVIRIVDHGAFTGLFAQIDEVDLVGRRVVVELDLIRRKVPIWLDEGKFEVV